MKEKSNRKRGRKPKGGKLVEGPSEENVTEGYIANVILHLKCRASDVLAPQTANPSPYDEYPDSSASFSTVKPEPNSEVQTLTSKLKALSFALASDTVSDKKSACFWCTYNFATPPIHIPKHKSGGVYHVYGCFCSPQCAAAHLFQQKNLDKSALHERYALLNNVYGSIYQYNENIKPAPGPHYLLDKFYGTLGIADYRKLLQTERVLLVVEAPLTRSLPEIHIHPADVTGGNKARSQYRLCRSERPRSKTDQLAHSFGF